MSLQEALYSAMAKEKQVKRFPSWQETLTSLLSYIKIYLSKLHNQANLTKLKHVLTQLIWLLRLPLLIKAK